MLFVRCFQVYFLQHTQDIDGYIIYSNEWKQSVEIILFSMFVFLAELSYRVSKSKVARINTKPILVYEP